MLCFGSCFWKIEQVCECTKKRLSWILTRAKQHSEYQDEDPYYFSLSGRENMASVKFVFCQSFGKGQDDEMKTISNPTEYVLYISALGVSFFCMLKSGFPLSQN